MRRLELFIYPNSIVEVLLNKMYRDRSRGWSVRFLLCVCVCGEEGKRGGRNVGTDSVWILEGRENDGGNIICEVRKERSRKKRNDEYMTRIVFVYCGAPCH